ncbi:NFX1-type zinc finger-containing protein 1-like isoform X2 [Procambarus clarkii]|uniref:NFX1-type zinc finger-containing protein 1-like isoform X2 n=1 Tax=Procambarus clarkii TaxID=6728 RepID=UPI003741EA83
MRRNGQEREERGQYKENAKTRGREAGAGDTFVFHRGRGGAAGKTLSQRERYSRERGNGNHWRQRGSQSEDDLSAADNRNTQSLERYDQKSNRRKRENPIGYKALENMLSLYPDEVVMKLQMENSGYYLLIHDVASVSLDKICLLMRVLSHASETRSNRENLYNLLSKTFKPTFISQLIEFSIKFSLQPDNETRNTFFDELSKIVHVYVNVMPNRAVDNIYVLLETCIMVLQKILASSQHIISVLNKIQETKALLEEHKQKLQESGHVQRKGKHKDRWEDHLPPPDDFREVSVLPTTQDLNDVENPFLRRNIVEGKYLDVNHYLDVQFRLLREDFVRPLRDGIRAFRSNVRSQNRDIWIYRDVRIIGADIQSYEMIHHIQLNLPEKFKLENSKRLLYGNLLCFSKDKFCSIILGSIADRNTEKIKDGIIGIKFESDIGELKDSVFTMAESRSYFVAYKHVLSALQDITEDSFPLESYIVHVQPYMEHPSYLSQHSVYDLRVLRRANMMKESEAYSKLFQTTKKIVLNHDDDLPRLQAVRVMDELQHWPTEDDLGLDDSQRRALHSALVRKLAIIQGPPGTGKTFVGLKITQVLLHNSQEWKNENQPSPILVVCFTNHALDQFLEGMSQYTDNIVRVGSRTKSEIIARFQINQLAKNLRSRRSFPAEIHKMNTNLLWQVREQQKEVLSLRRVIQELSSPSGILALDVFSLEDILSVHVLEQFREMSLKTWLLDTKLCTDDLTQVTTKKKTTNQLNKNSKSKLVDEVWQDAEDLFGAEEIDRMMDDRDLQDDLSTSGTDRNILRYDITAKSLEKDIEAFEIRDNMSALDLKVKELLKNHQNRLKLGLETPLVDAEKVRAYENTNIRALNFKRRWELYKLWLSRLSEKFNKKLQEVENEFRHVTKAWREIRDQEYLYVMRHAAVVGMTTTGAASYCHLVQALQPPVVIIEEAAEILEAHVITSLTGKCQHLIMIGDHQQLQPSATVYELAQKYGLEMSLFERMIQNNMTYERLEYQHRMRPNISRLLVPSIYPSLKDHPSVHQYPHVKGITTDLFFITHHHHEKSNENDDNNSHENLHEGELIMALCRHLMLQGYSSTDITILTPYTGQFFLLKKIQRKFEVCKNVRISVVDNFQGEESNIILLSLVRSNAEQKVGFLRINNRVCVALSRAKHGLYITGNMDQLRESSDLWRKIEADLFAEKALGKSLTLRCENHHDQLISVATGSDILMKSPEGGCLRPCSFFLPKCGHSCPMTCHMSDKEHMEVKCPLPCPEILCERYHPCPGKCWESCNPCIVYVPKTLSCGHTHKIRCCNYNNNEINCRTIVEKNLPACQHRVKIPCYIKPETLVCPIPCDVRLECGHKCTKSCHVTEDPDHLTYKCQQECTRISKDCSLNHPCKGLCHENCRTCTIKIKKKALCGHIHEVECCMPRKDIKCQNKCRKMLECGHHCPKKCFEECGGCQVMVKSVVPGCLHEIQIRCGLIPLKSQCHGPCVLQLACGHQCQERCNEPCSASCRVRVTSPIRCPKYHFIKVPCHLRRTCTKNHEAAWPYCTEPCGTVLDCGHVCKGQCGDCLHGRLHVVCGEKCGKSLVCGHVCKADCSSDCPPCQRPCTLRCVHSRCTSRCGEPCRPCQEKCVRKCKHRKCKNLCGEKCSVSPCQENCPEKLGCGHPCVGFCGEPCPPLCRTCNTEQLTEILFGSEEDENARY